MGLKLKDYYDKASAMGGMKAKMRLALLTAVSSQKAETEPDSPELIKKFQEAMAELQKEFK